MGDGFANMLTRSEAIDLINDLDGDEYPWVDAKEDYYVLGLNNKLADFIKDIAAMTNTDSEQDRHYILIGVDDATGELVGVSEDYDESDGPPYHILSIDDAKLNTTISDYLSPRPSLTLRKFTSRSPQFGILEIPKVTKKPAVIQNSLEFHGDTKLQKGLVYLRKGSSNTIALKSDLENMIDRRISKRRDEILDGITKAVEVGPEAVAQVGEVVHEEDGDLTIEIGNSGDFVVEERISRDPISDLDSQLNTEISLFATQDNYLIDSIPLWDYYASSDEISIDDEATLVLAHSSLENRVYGIYWLTYTDQDSIRQILNSYPHGHHSTNRVAKVYAAIGDSGGLEEFYSQSDENTSGHPFSRFHTISAKKADRRLQELVERESHDIGYKEWSKEIDIRSLDIEDARELARTITYHMHELEMRRDGFDRWHSKKENFKAALCDVEIALGTLFFDK